MAQAPGKHYRKGITLIDAVNKFGDDATAEKWFVERRWPNGIRCAYCQSERIATRKPSARRKTPLYHCNDCKRDFTVKTGTILHDSKLPLSKWAIAFYLYSTNLKGVSSMKLHRDLGITQKTAWYMAHRLRQTWNASTASFAGPVEADETYIGGKEGNKHSDKRIGNMGGTTGKTAVVGLKDRSTNQVHSKVVARTDKRTLQDFVLGRAAYGSDLYTDDALAYRGLPNHETVRHSVREYVNGMAHTNGIESHWALLKRGYHGTYHHMSPKHLHRYIAEFDGRHNRRSLDTLDQMAAMARGAVGKRLTYRRLIR